jgi:hypothetical protein
MIVKKYAIYKIEQSSFDSNSHINVNSYNSNEFNIKLNTFPTPFSKMVLIRKYDLSIKNPEDNVKSAYFDTEIDAMEAVRLNMHMNPININTFDSHITILPVLEEVTELQEIRRLKIKGILQDD